MVFELITAQAYTFNNNFTWSVYLWQSPQRRTETPCHPGQGRISSSSLMVLLRRLFSSSVLWRGDPHMFFFGPQVQTSFVFYWGPGRQDWPSSYLQSWQPQQTLNLVLKCCCFSLQLKNKQTNKQEHQIKLNCDHQLYKIVLKSKLSLLFGLLIWVTTSFPGFLTYHYLSCILRSGGY